MNHRPGARLSAGSQTVLPTVRFSPATLVEFTAAANMSFEEPGWEFFWALAAAIALFAISVASDNLLAQKHLHRHLWGLTKWP
jgi:hypothetical protein